MIYLDNPRRKRHRRRRGSSLRGWPRDARGRLLSRSHRGHRRARRRGRRHYRRNPGTLALYGAPQAVLGNPRRRRRHYRRNPRRGGLLRGGYLRELRQSIPDVAWGLEGFTVTSMGPQYITRFLPMVAKENNRLFYFGTKSALALVNGRVVSRFAGSRAGQAAQLGGLLTVGAELIKDYLFPMLGLSAYLDAYLDAGALGYQSSAALLGSYGVETATGVDSWSGEMLPARLSADARGVVGE